jgi:alcohol dehydrogenase class IV
MTEITAAIELLMPPRVEIGLGSLTKLPEWVEARKVRRVLVVSGGYNAQRVSQLGLTGSVRLFGDVKPEPDIENLNQAVTVADDFEPDCIIGFGGGSAMDLAKLVAVLYRNSKSVRDIAGMELAPRRRCVLVQVPTTAGTGSEAGIRALVTDPVTRSKLAVQSREMLADLVIIDATLTMTSPPHVSAATGVDAMAHCVEAYTSKRAHPVTDLYAREGIRLIGRYLPIVVRNGSDIRARAALALASFYGGICLGPVNTTAGHAVAYPLGTRHHIAHGAANALIFPHTLAFNFSAAKQRTEEVMMALGLDATGEEPIRAAAHAFCARLGIEMHLSALNIPRDDLPIMAGEAAGIRRLLDHNPRDIGRDEILNIYERAY